MTQTLSNNGITGVASGAVDISCSWPGGLVILQASKNAFPEFATLCSAKLGALTGWTGQTTYPENWHFSGSNFCNF